LKARHGAIHERDVTMTLRSILFAGASAIALASNASAGELRGTYAAIEGGAGWVASERFLQATAVTSVITTSALYDVDFDTGWAIFGTLGYAFTNNLRAELEVGYRHNEIETLRQLLPAPGALSPDGDLGEFTVMANLLYDIPLGERLTLSIGAGVGGDQANLMSARSRLTMTNGSLPIKASPD
jgi:opacity protein-like surface antigen